jgi:hypothetical protein
MSGIIKRQRENIINDYINELNYPIKKIKKVIIYTILVNSFLMFMLGYGSAINGYTVLEYTVLIVAIIVLNISFLYSSFIELSYYKKISTKEGDEFKSEINTGEPLIKCMQKYPRKCKKDE